MGVHGTEAWYTNGKLQELHVRRSQVWRRSVQVSMPEPLVQFKLPHVRSGWSECVGILRRVQVARSIIMCQVCKSPQQNDETLIFGLTT